MSAKPIPDLTPDEALQVVRRLRTLPKTTTPPDPLVRQIISDGIADGSIRVCVYEGDEDSRTVSKVLTFDELRDEIRRVARECPEAAAEIVAELRAEKSPPNLRTSDAAAQLRHRDESEPEVGP